MYKRQRRSGASALLCRRWLSSSAPVQYDELKSAFAERLPKEQKRLKAIKTEHGSKEIHSVNVGMVLGGMRGITGLLYEASLLDADEGIRFRGYTIPDLQVCKSTRLFLCRSIYLLQLCPTRESRSLHGFGP